MKSYKVIQRVLAGGCMWSGLLGAWVGPEYGLMGRAAMGVPEGFASGSRSASTSASASTGMVKVEGVL